MLLHSNIRTAYDAILQCQWQDCALSCTPKCHACSSAEVPCVWKPHSYTSSLTLQMLGRQTCRDEPLKAPRRPSMNQDVRTCPSSCFSLSDGILCSSNHTCGWKTHPQPFLCMTQCMNTCKCSSMDLPVRELGKLAVGFCHWSFVVPPG